MHSLMETVGGVNQKCQCKIRLLKTSYMAGLRRICRNLQFGGLRTVRGTLAWLFGEISGLGDAVLRMALQIGNDIVHGAAVEKLHTFGCHVGAMRRQDHLLAR